MKALRYAYEAKSDSDIQPDQKEKLELVYQKVQKIFLEKAQKIFLERSVDLPSDDISRGADSAKSPVSQKGSEHQR